MKMIIDTLGFRHQTLNAVNAKNENINFHFPSPNQ